MNDSGHYFTVRHKYIVYIVLVWIVYGGLCKPKGNSDISETKRLGDKYVAQAYKPTESHKVQKRLTEADLNKPGKY